MAKNHGRRVLRGYKTLDVRLLPSQVDLVAQRSTEGEKGFSSGALQVRPLLGLCDTSDHLQAVILPTILRQMLSFFSLMV